MAAENQAQMQAVLTQHDRVRRSTDIPMFYGDERRDTVSPHQLIKRIEGAAEIAHWDEANEDQRANGPRKCEELYMCLRHSALSWFNSLADLGVNEKNWPELKVEFLDAYAPRFSARTLCTSFQDLKQKSDEKVQQFFHRVADAFSDAYRAKPLEVVTFTGTPEQRGTANQALATELVKMGVQKMQLLMMSTIFLGGLKDEIRVRVLESGPENIKSALKLAREVEVILGDAAKRPKGVTVAALQELGIDEEESQTVINTLNAIKTNKRGAGNAGYRGNNPRGNPPKTPDPSASGGFVLTCYYCSIPGHIARDCRKKARDMGTGGGNQGATRNNKPGVKSIQENSDPGAPRGGHPGATNPFTEDFGTSYPAQINTIRSLYAGYEQEHHLN